MSALGRVRTFGDDPNGIGYVKLSSRVMRGSDKANVQGWWNTRHLNREAYAIYADFTTKVAKGRTLPLAHVQDIAKGRIWSGVDGNAHGLVDELGGLWTATNAAKKLAGIAPGERVSFRFYPRQKSLFDAIGDLFGNPEVSARAVQGFVMLMNAAPVRAIVGAISDLPRGGVELRATNLPGSP